MSELPNNFVFAVASQVISFLVFLMSERKSQVAQNGFE